jgi:nitroreductase
METFDAIKARRGIREYADTPIEEEKLTQILEAGRRAPSSRNSQRWDFVVVRDKAMLADLSKVWRGAAHIAGAPVAIGVVAPLSEDLRETASINLDLGQAIASMMIAAADLGIGSRHAAVEDHELATSLLNLPQGQQLTWLFGLGYPVDRAIKPIVTPDRRPFEEVVHYETWAST